MWIRSPRSGRFVRPMGIAPWASIRSTAGAVAGATASARTGSPLVVGWPATSMFSLTVNGTPWNRPVASPRATAASAASAAASAESVSTRTTAFTWPFTSAMRSRCACTTCLLVHPPDLMPAASSSAPLRQSSCAMP